MTMLPRSAETLINDVVADAELCQKVVLHLASCRPELQGLTVTVTNGSVTLSGEIPTFFLRQLAVERTRHVAGVRLVIDHIDVPVFIARFNNHAK